MTRKRIFDRVRATLVALASLIAVACDTISLPDPSLSAYDVVQIQLLALQRNDQPVDNHGIAVAWNFASPNNKENTGPLERFTLMVQNEHYRPLLNSNSFELRCHYQQEVDAEFFVMVEDLEGLVYSFMVSLSLQKDEPYQGCWMIDSIIPMELPGGYQVQTATLPGLPTFPPPSPLQSPEPIDSCLTPKTNHGNYYNIRRHSLS